MPICRLAYADFKMAYADTFIGRFAVGGLLTSWLDADLATSSPFQVDKALAQPPHLAVRVQRDARPHVALLHIDHHMVLLIVFRYFHSFVVLK